MVAITQFGLYPRFFVRKKDILFPLIEKYTGEPLGSKSKGQVVKIYFNLLRTNSAFKTEVDALIKEQGGKLLTIQERIMAKKSAKVEKTKGVQIKTTETKVNFMNATDVTNTDLEGTTEADFIAAITYEEKQERISDVIKIGGLIVLVVGACMAYKYFKK